VLMYNKTQSRVLQVRPGITDIATLVFSNESEWLHNKRKPEQFYIERVIPLKIRLNRIYIRNQSARTYFTIIVWTIMKLIRARPARLKESEALCQSWMERPAAAVAVDEAILQ